MGRVIRAHLAVAASLLLVFAINVVFYPDRNIPIVYAVPLLLAALMLPSRGVLIVGVFALALNRVSVSVEGTPIEVWPITTLALLAIALGAYLLARQREVTAQRTAALELVTRQLSGVALVSEVALSYLDLDEVLREQLARIRKVLASDTATVLLIDDDEARLIVRASSGLEEEVEQHVAIPVGKGIAGRVIASLRPIVVDDLSLTEVVSPRLSGQLRSLAAVPLVAGGRAIGVLHVGTFKPRRFSQEDVHLLELVAERAASGIDRARLYEAQRQARADAEGLLEEVQAQREELECQNEVLTAVNKEHEAWLIGLRTLIRVSHDVLAETALEGLLQRVADAARELTGAGVVIAGHGYAAGEFRVGASSRLEGAVACPPGQVFAIEKGGVHLELIEKVSSIRLTDKELRAHPRWWGLPAGHCPMRGLLGVRLVGANGQPNGLILATDREQGDFTAEDEALLQQLAGLASLGLQNVEALAALELERDRARESGERLRLAQEGTHVGVWDWYPRTGALSFTSELELLYGLTPGTVKTYEDWRQRVHPEDIASIEAELGEALAKHRPFELEFRILHTSGEMRWIYAKSGAIYDETGEVVRVLGVNLDITERKRAEAERELLLEEVRRQAAELDASLGAIADGLIIYGPRGEIVRTNAVAEEMLGLRPEERDQSILDLAPTQHYETTDGTPVPVKDLPQMRALRGEMVPSTVLGFRRPGRPLRWLAISAAPIRAPGDELIGAASNFADVTALREHQEHQKEFVSLISHDLRSPLTNVLGMAQLLMRGLSKKGFVGEALGAERIVGSARRMQAMIQDLADSVRMEVGQFELNVEPTDLPQLIADLVERVGKPEDRHRIRVAVPESVPAVLADRERIERAITNLLTNALKYSAADQPVDVGIGRQDDLVLLSVADHGVGIPADDVPHLFDRHFRAKTAGKREGLGLGLYITRIIAEAHGGKVYVESEVGKGATFHLALPLA